MLGDILALFSAFCWALNGVVYKLGLRYGDVVTANFVRVTLTATGFVTIMLLKGELFEILTDTPPRIWALVFLSAIFAFFVGDMLYMESIRRCGVSRAVPISSTYPLFVSLWSALLFGRIEPNVVVGAALIVISIRLVVGGEGRRDFGGYAMALGGAVFWSFSITIVKTLTSYLPPEAIAGFRFAMVSVLLLPFALRRDFDPKCVKWMSLSSLIMISGNYAFVFALSISSATVVSTLSSLYPILAQFLAMGVRERVTVRVILGTVLAVLGVALTTLITF